MRRTSLKSKAEPNKRVSELSSGRVRKSVSVRKSLHNTAKIPNSKKIPGDPDPAEQPQPQPLPRSKLTTTTPTTNTDMAMNSPKPNPLGDPDIIATSNIVDAPEAKVPVFADTSSGPGPGPDPGDGDNVNKVKPKKLLCCRGGCCRKKNVPEVHFTTEDEKPEEDDIVEVPIVMEEGQQHEQKNSIGSGTSGSILIKSVHSSDNYNWLDISDLRKIKSVNDVKVKLFCKGRTGSLCDFCFVFGFIQIGIAVICFVGKILTTLSSGDETNASTSMPDYIMYPASHIVEFIAYAVLLLTGLILVIGVSYRQKWVTFIHTIGCALNEALLITVLVLIGLSESPIYRRTYAGPLWLSIASILLLVNLMFGTYSALLFMSLDAFLLELGDLSNDDALIHDSLSAVRIRTTKQRKKKRKQGLTVSFSESQLDDILRREAEEGDVGVDDDDDGGSIQSLPGPEEHNNKTNKKGKSSKRGAHHPKKKRRRSSSDADDTVELIKSAYGFHAKSRTDLRRKDKDKIHRV